MEEIVLLLKSRKLEDRSRAVRRLRRLQTPEAQRLLLQALRDRASYVAALAAEALGEIADYEAAAEMQERFLYLSADGLKRDPGCHIRAYLAFAFGRLEYRLASDALKIGIRTRQIEAVGGVPFDTAAHLRANCALALAQMRDFDALRDITLLLFDTGTNAVGARSDAPKVTEDTRKAAAQALAILSDPNSCVPLSIKLAFPEGESSVVIQECMQSIVALQDERAIELLSTYLDHRDRHLAAFAAVMIAQTRAPEALDLIRETLPRFSGDPLRAVILALSTLRTAEADILLRALAGDLRAEVRQIAKEVLGDQSENEPSSPSSP